MGLTTVRVLGIDTATKHASIGICEDGEVCVERTETGVVSHAMLILPLVEEVLTAAGIEVGDLDAVAVSAGPGSFTGLRIGLSVAKGLACATGVRVVGVPTLEALAHTVAARSGEIWAVLDARKGEVYAASFTASEDGVRRLTGDVVMAAASLIDVLPSSCTVVGDIEARYGELLRAGVGPGLELLPFDQFGPRGGVVARLGAVAVSEGRAVDPAALEPVYIRASDAERLHG